MLVPNLNCWKLNSNPETPKITEKSRASTDKTEFLCIPSKRRENKIHLFFLDQSLFKLYHRSTGFDLRA
jgi:hypothetical protein